MGPRRVGLILAGARADLAGRRSMRGGNRSVSLPDWRPGSEPASIGGRKGGDADGPSTLQG